MIEFQEEVYQEVIEELKPLFKDHYEEIAMYKDKIALNPDYDKYDTLGEHLFIVTARDEGTLIGYTIFFVNNHLHYKDHMYAANDIIYIDPKYRHDVAAFEMMEYAEDLLKHMGVSVISMHMKAYAAFETLMKALNFDKAEFIYTKYIGK